VSAFNAGAVQSWHWRNPVAFNLPPCVTIDRIGVEFGDEMRLLLQVFAACLALASSALAQPGPACDPRTLTLTAGVAGPIYSPRPRGYCEGLFAGEVSSAFSLLSLSRGPLMFNPQSDAAAQVSAEAPASLHVRFLAQAIAPDRAYRLDAKGPATGFSWALDYVVKPMQWGPRDIGILAFTESGFERTYFPAVVRAAPLAGAPALPLVVRFRTPEHLEDVRGRLSTLPCNAPGGEWTRIVAAMTAQTTLSFTPAASWPAGSRVEIVGVKRNRPGNRAPTAADEVRLCIKLGAAQS
jgi:hypothetical protein